MITRKDEIYMELVNTNGIEPRNDLNRYLVSLQAKGNLARFFLYSKIYHHLSTWVHVPSRWPSCALCRDSIREQFNWFPIVGTLQGAMMDFGISGNNTLQPLPHLQKSSPQVRVTCS